MTHNPATGIRDCIASLMAYCGGNNWAGFDPYDALNSRLFSLTPFARSRVCRIAITQIMKRLPLNLRPLLLVPREQNPKAIALFLVALLKLSKLGLLEPKDLVEGMVERLVTLRSPNTSYWCWGYSFPWQTRTDLVPRWAPNLVCTAFVADALLDLYEEKHEPRYLNMAVSAGEYIINDLYWTEDGSACGFSYPIPGIRARVHNANFLGSALLSRIYKLTGEKQFIEPALKVARYSARRQRDDGSWDYGELPSQRWVDNFHTGYNLCALRSIVRHGEAGEFESHLRLGFEFYRKHFINVDGEPRYFHNQTYPIDIHSVAQSIITLLELRDLREDNADLAFAVYGWAMNHMWNERGYFYYQVLPLVTNRISYMRWSQAWMLKSLATLLEDREHGPEGTCRHESREVST
ncbi:MAG: hypothetical protein P0111_07515 [Nitrospira sp.]|nr:hypothetical protein [Nitrospira sp.]